MRDTEQAPRRRIQACEHLLDYECPTKVIEESKACILAIVEAAEVDLKLDGLKLLRRVEAKRVSPGRVVSQRDIEISRAYEILVRRDALYRAGIHPFPPDYADDLMDANYVPAPNPPDPEPAPDMATTPRKARLRAKKPS